MFCDVEVVQCLHSLSLCSFVADLLTAAVDGFCPLVCPKFYSEEGTLRTHQNSVKPEKLSHLFLQENSDVLYSAEEVSKLHSHAIDLPIVIGQPLTEEKKKILNSFDEPSLFSIQCRSKLLTTVHFDTIMTRLHNLIGAKPINWEQVKLYYSDINFVV